MERSKSIISMVVGLAAILIIWRVGFYPPAPKQTEKPAETEIAVEPEKPDILQKPGDLNEPMVTFDVNDSERITDVNEPEKLVADTESSETFEPNEPMESVNLKSVEMKSIIQKLADWTGKVIIPTDESMQQRVTIYAPAKLPRSEALSMIYAALLMKGYAAEHAEKAIYLKPVGDIKLGEVPTIASDYPLAMVENKDQIVQKFFKLDNYSPSQMGQIILPLMGEYGYVSADEGTSSLLVIDTVKNLMRIGLIIEQYDVVEAEEIVTEIFEIRHGNPSEIVELLEKLLSSGDGSRSIRGPVRGPFPPPRPSPVSSSSSKTKSKTTSGVATAVTVGTSRTPAVLIPEMTYNWIIAKATPEDIEQIRMWIEKLDKSVPTMLVDYPLTSIENKNQIVQKFFKLQNYSPAQMVQVISPLLGDTGYASADESTRTLLVIDTVENLIRLEGIIAQFDIPEAEQAVTDIFEIRYGDPSEIVQMLKILLGESEGYSRSRSSSSSRYGRDDRNRYSGSSSSSSSSSRYGFSGNRMPTRSSSGGSTSVSVGTTAGPIILIPEPRRKGIIARASAEEMKQIEMWIEKLDVEEPVESEFEIVQLRYADPSEVEESVEGGFRELPGTEFLPSVIIEPLYTTKQVMVFGRKDLREIVKKMIAEIDVPPGLFDKVHFKLKYADPDEVKQKLEEIYEEQIGGSSSSSRYGSSYYSSSSRGRRGSSTTSSEMVRVISYIALRQITVIASPENIVDIKKLIEEWDIPLDVEALKPRIIELRNTDPVQMAGLLTTLFSESSGSSGRGGRSIYDYIFGNAGTEKQKIIGPLYGQMTFEEVPDTKKIIMISNIAEAYEVVENMIRELDSAEMAEVPVVIELKYADPEDLSERLNALFVESGQQARIRLTAEGLSAASEMADTSTSASSSDTSSTGQNTYTPPWSGSGARSGVNNEMPISNVIGRVRFVPEPHTKSIMVLSPPEFLDEINTMISDLDVPGKQVVIEAIIVEIEHSKVTSLGVELSTNPGAFGSIGENALVALGNLTHIGTHGSASGTISSGTGVWGVTGASGTVLGAGSDVYALIDFLIKTTNAKILNQQTLWTKDNEEANFFKGSEVAFLSSESITNQTATQGIDFEKVGMELRARPSITPEDNVDMIINVQISALTSELVNNQPVRSKMNTTTNMIVPDDQTLMLGGILFQKDNNVEHKLPLLGDVPLIGALFRHYEVIHTNSEVLVFMTPHVVEEPTDDLPEAIGPLEKLGKVREELDATMKGLK